MCQGMEVDEWIDKQQENVLDVPYFHTVFTIPEELYSLVYSNQKLLYDAFYIFPYEFTNSDKGKNKGKKIL